MSRFKRLNEIAELGGVVIFGGTEAHNIPLCELKQAFSLKENYYNRSIGNLSIADANEIYKTYISELKPDTVLLNIGEADIKTCADSPDECTINYREVISQIRKDNKKCRIAIISLKNYDSNDDITQLNKHLKYIAASEKCEFCDISTKRVWNPNQKKDVVSFIYDIGFVRPLNIKRPLNDLVSMLFCYDV